MSLDPDQIQKRFDRITEIFSDIVNHAETTEDLLTRLMDPEPSETLTRE